MRYTPAALALSLAFGLTASVLYSAPSTVLDPRAAALVEEGRGAVAAGQIDQAIDHYEAALAIQPGSVPVMLELADATRRQGMQGKALHYYRVALVQDPQNIEAITGEGTALVEKGAVEKAKRSLARLTTLCGKMCPQTKQLAAVIAKGPTPRMVSADEVKPTPVVSQN